MRWKMGLLFAMLLVALNAGAWAQTTPADAPPLRLVNIEPLGEWLAGQPAVLTFDRMLDCSATYRVFVVQPAGVSGDASCEGDTLRFGLTTPLQRGEIYRLLVDGVRGVDGAVLEAPVGIDLLAQSALQVTSFTPTNGRDDVSAVDPITVAFSRPMVALSALDAQDSLPNPLRFNVPVEGRGEWLNTSTYQFTPVALPGGQTVIVTIEGQTALDGAELAEPFVASFVTVPPAVVEALPANDDAARLTSKIQIRFNQPMDQQSTQQAFYLRSLSGPAVSGTFEWADDGLGFAFTPSERLPLDTRFVYGFSAGIARAAAGNGTLRAYEYGFSTLPPPALVKTYPRDGQTDARPYDGFVLTFNTIIDPETVLDRLTITPEPRREPTGYFSEYTQEYTVVFGLEGSTSYNVSVAPGIADIYGNTIDTPFTFSFTTGPLASELSLNVPQGIGIYDADRAATELYVTYLNLERIDLQLSTVDLERLLGQLLGSNYYNFTDYLQPAPGEIIRQWSVPAPIRDTRVLDLVNIGERPEPGETVTGGLVSCPDAMPSRTKAGDRAIVITEPDPLRVRSAPQTGEIIDLLYKGYALSIVQGPTCLNGIAWFEVRLRDDRTGWVAEGLNDEYFLEVTSSASVTSVDLPSDLLTGGALPVGSYLLSVSAPDFGARAPEQHVMVVTDTGLVLKHGAEEAMVWAFDLHTGQPLADLPVSLVYPYTAQGDLYYLEGRTDEWGVAFFEYGRRDNLYTPLVALVNTGDRFGLTSSRWSNGLDSYYFDIYAESYPSRYSVYMYTDRAVYRPGQTVYFRGIVRMDNDNDYPQPDLSEVWVMATNASGETILSESFPLSAYGTFTGQLTLDSQAELGYYNIRIELPRTASGPYEGGSVSFDVAAYRLPEFQVKVDAPTEVLRGEVLDASADLTYFFGGPVSNAAVNVFVTSRQYFFDYTGDGRYSFYDYNADETRYVRGYSNYESGTSGDNGRYTFRVPTEAALDSQGVPLRSGSEIYEIEATSADESGFSVSGRTEVIIHQAEWYVGVNAREFVATAGQETTADLIVVDWDSRPIAGQSVTVEVVERRWNSTQEVNPYNGQLVWRSEVEEIPLTEGRVITDANGKASFTFTPPSGGIFKVRARVQDGGGREAVSSTFVWASGLEFVPWRIANSSRIELIADKTQYDVGDVAEILITSPFAGRTEALLTIERDGVIAYDRLTLESNSTIYRLPIQGDYAPNVYVSVMLVKGVDATNGVTDHRMGLIRLPVNNSAFKLDVDIQTDSDVAGPRDTVNYIITVRDSRGEPVRAELGVALTDLASLALRQQNLPSLLEFYYGSENLKLLTAGTLTINTDLITQFTRDVIKGGGGGGGGDGGILDLREEFTDTPFWDGQLETDANGRASISVTLPDNLTTWRLDVRGLTMGSDSPMLVGQATSDLIATKPLIIRPVAPRFFVAGDVVELAAVINNNTDSPVEGVATLFYEGVTLDGDAVQTVTIPANGRARVAWPAVVMTDAQEVELVFSVEGGGYRDASRPSFGQGENRVLPVYRFEVQEFNGTGGVLREAATRTESVSLPRRYIVTDGDVTVRIEPSLAVSAIESLRAFEGYRCDCLETQASWMMSNLSALRMLRTLRTPLSDLGAYEAPVYMGLQRFAALQKPNGGWGWYEPMDSDLLTTAWVMLALTEAREAGFAVDEMVYDRGLSYLRSNLGVTSDMSMWQMDRAAMAAYAMARAGRSGGPLQAVLSNLYDFSGIRQGSVTKLSLSGQALLMMAMQKVDGADPRLPALRDSLLGAAVITANGAQWPEAQRDFYNWNSDTRATAMVMKALLSDNPLEPVLPNAVRWLMVARGAQGWETPQETAWSLSALADWMIASGENQPDYTYRVLLNGGVVTEGVANSDTVAIANTFTQSLAGLSATQPNPVVFERGAGAGAMYYTAYISPYVPVESVSPVSRGFSLERSYRLLDDRDAGPIDSAAVGQLVEVTLTVTVANPAHYVVISDPVPAGTEPVDTRLSTNQQTGTDSSFESVQPEDGGGYLYWWVGEQFRDEQVVLSADYLAAGVYQYRYLVRAAVPGTYKVIPAIARELYFPEVYGRSAGTQFTVVGE